MRIKLGRYVYYTSLLPRVRRVAPTGVPGETREQFMARMEEAEAQAVRDALARSRRRYQARELIAAGHTDQEVLRELWVEA